MSEDLSGLLHFAKIWNASSLYVSNYDLERVLGKSIKEIHDEADRYHQLQELHKNLPELIWRRLETGQPIPIPQKALKQLDPFRIDRKKLKNIKGVVVTSAQFGATLHEAFWTSLRDYAEYRDFALVVMPIKYGPIYYAHGHITTTFPQNLRGHVLFEDIILGKGKSRIQLNVTRMRPTLGRFLTDDICRKGGTLSQIFAAPALELEHRVRFDNDHPDAIMEHPKAIMTTGAISRPNYSDDKLGQQDRTAEIAIDQHSYSAIVVEFDRDICHFRQLVSDEKGHFYDIDPIRGGARLFTPEGHSHKPDDVESLVTGDWHTGKTCPNVKKATFGDKGMALALKPKNIVFHDFIDGDSVSHYEEKQATRRAWKAPHQFDSMELELQNGVKEMEWIQSRVPFAKLHMVASNHPEFLTEYIDKMRWVKDDINLEFGSHMFNEMVQSIKKKNPKKVEAIATDPIILYFRKHLPFVNTLERTDKLFLGKKTILCSCHGDIGPRGAPTRSLKEFLKYNCPVILGHNHTGTIFGPIWRVGTSTPRMQFYVTTPDTQWSNTHCVIFNNGQRMLLNIIKQKWHGFKQSTSNDNASDSELFAA